MYFFKRILMSFKRSVGIYLYECILFAVIIAILSFQIIRLKSDYEQTYFVENYDKDLYMYANVMDYVWNEIKDDKEKMQFINQLEEIDGVKGLGYTRGLYEYYHFEEDETVNIMYINDIMANISYKCIEGKWFTETEQNTGKIKVVIGSEVGCNYKIGDSIEITRNIDGEKIECEIIGIIHKDGGILSLSHSGSEKKLQKERASKDIYICDDRVLEGTMQDVGQYPQVNILISLEDEYDEDTLKKYGNLYSLDSMENVNDDYFSFIIDEIIKSYGVLLFVALFGCFSVIYLVLSKNMYITGVYSLLGQTRGKKVFENMIIQTLVYICGAILGYCLCKYHVRDGIYSRLNIDLWSDWNNIFIIILGFIVLFITLITSMCMIRKNPKEIIIIAKNMEG